MPRVPPLDREATYDDLVKLPDLYVAEIVGGELHATRRLPPRHGVASTMLGALVGGPYDLARGGPGGWWILFGAEVHLGDDVLVPDWAGWRRTRVPRLPDAFFSLAPDWVCEVLTPATAEFDRTQKLGIYAREGVPHAWLLDPIARTLEALRLTDGGWTVVATHAGRDTARVEPFAEIDLELSALWAEP